MSIRPFLQIRSQSQVGGDISLGEYYLTHILLTNVFNSWAPAIPSLSGNAHQVFVEGVNEWMNELTHYFSALTSDSPGGLLRTDCGAALRVSDPAVSGVRPKDLHCQ